MLTAAATIDPTALARLTPIGDIAAAAGTLPAVLAAPSSAAIAAYKILSDNKNIPKSGWLFSDWLSSAYTANVEGRALEARPFSIENALDVWRRAVATLEEMANDIRHFIQQPGVRELLHAYQQVRKKRDASIDAIRLDVLREAAPELAERVAAQLASSDEAEQKKAGDTLASLMVEEWNETPAYRECIRAHCTNEALLTRLCDHFVAEQDRIEDEFNLRTHAVHEAFESVFELEDLLGGIQVYHGEKLTLDKHEHILTSPALLKQFQREKFMDLLQNVHGMTSRTELEQKLKEAETRPAAPLSNHPYHRRLELMEGLRLLETMAIDSENPNLDESWRQHILHAKRNTKIAL